MSKPFIVDDKQTNKQKAIIDNQPKDVKILYLQLKSVLVTSNLSVLVCTCVYLFLSTGAVSLDWFHSSQNQQLKLANKATEGGITVIMSAELGLYLMLCQDSTRPVFTCAPIPYRTIHLAWLWILGKFIPCTSLENTLQKTSNAFVLNPRPQIRPSSKGSI